MQSPTQEIVEKVILENFIEYQYLFVEFQTKFLSGLFFKYQSIESGNLVLYYAKQAHQDILRKKDYDLNFNISFDKFWKNHHESNPPRIPIIKIGEDTFLPKETARRKILQLINQKVLNKKNRNIGFLPNEQYKQSYNVFIEGEIKEVCKLICYVCDKINFSTTREKVVEEVKDKFSFYWFHYLGAQLEYLKLWIKQLKDVELVLIALQVVHLFTLRAKEKKLSHTNIFDNPSLIKEYISASISATSVAEVTGIPRATCVRKLEILVKKKIISKDKISKKYYITPSVIGNNVFSRNITEKVTKLFSNFYFICIRALVTKI
jgi:hypothetical protein